MIIVYFILSALNLLNRWLVIFCKILSPKLTGSAGTRGTDWDFSTTCFVTFTFCSKANEFQANFSPPAHSEYLDDIFIGTKNTFNYNVSQ